MELARSIELLGRGRRERAKASSSRREKALRGMRFPLWISALGINSSSRVFLNHPTPVYIHLHPTLFHTLWRRSQVSYSDDAEDLDDLQDADYRSGSGEEEEEEGEEGEEEEDIPSSEQEEEEKV